MWQNIQFIGNLGGDPQMRYSQDGTPVTAFSVAVNRKWKNINGEPQEQVCWFRVRAWRKLAESCNQYLGKGSRALVEGTLTPDPETGGPRIWNDKDGNARAGYEITASNVLFLDKKADSGDNGGESGSEDEEPF